MNNTEFEARLNVSKPYWKVTDYLDRMYKDILATVVVSVNRDNITYNSNENEINIFESNTFKYTLKFDKYDFVLYDSENKKIISTPYLNVVLDNLQFEDANKLVNTKTTKEVIADVVEVDEEYSNKFESAFEFPTTIMSGPDVPDVKFADENALGGLNFTEIVSNIHR